MNTNIIQLIYKLGINRRVYLLLLFWFLVKTDVAAQNFWQQTNGLYGGVIQSLASNSHGHIFAGTLSGGVFRSTDGGGSWTHIGLTNTSVFSLAINSSGHIFAGAFDARIFRSIDNGNTWTVSFRLTNTNVFSLVINASGHIFAGTNNGVFRSTDGGDSWTPTNSGLANIAVLALAINPATRDIFAGTDSNGVFRSTDNGNSWTPANTGLRTIGVGSLAINSNGHIFSGTERNGVFRSTDNGNTWTEVNFGLTYTLVGSLAINSSGHIFVGTFGGVFRSIDNGNSWKAINTGLKNIEILTVAINSSGQIFVGTNGAGIFRSTDNGNTWIEVNTGLTSTHVEALALNSSGHIFAGTFGGGVLRSTDNGNIWTEVNFGLTNIHVRSLAINSSGHIFAGTFAGTPSGVFRSMDNGNSWKPVNAGLTNPSVVSLAINPDGHIFAGTGFGVFRSTDNGNSWERVNTDFMNSPIYSLAINPATRDIFAGTERNGVFRSTDNGNSWTSINTGLRSAEVWALAINASGYIFAGTWIGGVFRSTDNGNTWTEVNFGLTNTYIRSLAINSSGHIFAGTFLGGVFRSTDNGKIWTPVNTGLTNTDVVSFTINFNGNIFAGTHGSGVFRATHPMVKHTPTSLQETGREMPIVANITSDAGIDSVKLICRKGGDAEFKIISMSKKGGVYEGIIRADAVTSHGVEYFIIARDSADHIKQEPPSGIFSIPIRVDNETKPTAQPNGTERTAYRLISVPIQLDNPSPQAVLVDELGRYNIKKWRLFGFINGKYVEFPHAGAFTPGHSLFLIVKDPNKIIDAGPGQSIRTDKQYRITLEPGHNYMASPFNFIIPANNLRLASGSAIALWAYTGEWVKENVLSPWGGYYIGNNNQHSDTLFINPDLSSGLSIEAINKPDYGEGWRVQILVSCGEARDTQNFAGVAPTSVDGWDTNDLIEPPPIGEYVSLYFPHPEWHKIIRRYSDDLRSPETPSQRWNFAVESNITGEVITLRFDWLQEIPSEHSVFLVDFELGHKQNLRENATYQFRSREPDMPKELALIVGKEAFIAEQTADLPGVPNDFVLLQNFPNPFNPTTTIRYGLPQAERVTLKIYNLLGEEVALIINDELQAASYHVAIWDGRNKLGEVVGSGVYVYRFRAGSFTSIKKMALVK